ncbi:MAG TPA: hypothetical protein EYG77_01525 [Methanothermococcus okinawensis]|uniref:Uncharacterized protein n=1 Tax=Methanofervidicoccus abyssi TaxID=2082189 RepID=A0A401HP58_9EURY|nr:hypothetical protein [Methanofervidicoccus abyssi]GBF35985.1 hypothetical protein MHHB_P0210 [Methanofervidicoccus abyssi]HIP15868.1 hypothetical protein [Methanothermococcus okinawensis]
MIKYIKKFNEMKEFVDFLEKRGYTIRIRHKEDLILEIGSKKPNYLLKNTVGNLRICYLNTLKLILKLGLSIIKVKGERYGEIKV